MISSIKNMFAKKIVNKVLLVLVPTLLLGFGLLVCASVVTFSYLIDEHRKSIVSNEARNIMNRIDLEFAQSDKDLDHLSLSPLTLSFLKKKDYSSLSKFLRSLKQQYQKYAGIEFFDRKGNWVSSSSPAMLAYYKSTGEDFFGDQKWFIESSKGLYTDKFEFSNLYRGLVYSLYRPIFDPDTKKFLGLIRGVFSWNEFQHYLDTLIDQAYHQGSLTRQIIILDQEKRVIYGQDKDNNLRPFREFDTPFFKDKRGGSFYTKNLDDDDLLVGYSREALTKHTHDLGLIGLVFEHAGERYGMFNTSVYFQEIIIGVSLLFVLFFVVLLHIIVKKLMKPISELARTVETIVQTDDLDMDIQKTSEDEFGDLTNSFVKMIKRQNEITVSKDYVKNILDSIREMVFIVGKDGKVHYLNDTAKNTLEYSKGDVLGGPFSKLLVENDNNKSNEIVEKIVKGDFQGKVTFISSIKIEFQTFLMSMAMKGSDNEFVIIAKDISALKTSELQREKTYHELIKTSIMAGRAMTVADTLFKVEGLFKHMKKISQEVNDKESVEHIDMLRKTIRLIVEHKQDIGTFLSSDQVGKKLISQLSKLGDKVKGEHDQISNHVNALMEQVDPTIKKITQSKDLFKDVAVEDVYIDDVIEEILRISKSEIKENKIRVIKDVSVNNKIKISLGMINQFLINIVNYSLCSLSQTKKEELFLLFKVELQDVNHLKITIADNGLGFKKNMKESTFEKTGLLEICSLYAKQMNGEFVCHSDGENQGVTFSLFIPIAEEDEIKVVTS